jgi:hypothetical protein
VQYFRWVIRRALINFDGLFDFSQFLSGTFEGLKLRWPTESNSSGSHERPVRDCSRFPIRSGTYSDLLGSLGLPLHYEPLGTMLPVGISSHPPGLTPELYQKRLDSSEGFLVFDLFVESFSPRVVSSPNSSRVPGAGE